MRYLVAGRNPDCEVYLNGSDKYEERVFEAAVPERMNVWGDGWIGMDVKIDEELVPTRVYGKVMWRKRAHP
jgi:hypothetical protein